MLLNYPEIYGRYRNILSQHIQIIYEPEMVEFSKKS